MIETPKKPPRLLRTKRRRIILGLSVALMTAVLFVAGLEVAIRVLNRWNLLKTGEWDTYPGVRFKIHPKVKGMNGEGFRDVDRPFKKPDGVYRILFLGDSFVWGVIDREFIFTTLLEKNLNDLHPEKRIEVINLGVPSYGPEEALHLWKSYGVQYDPDAVICGFYYGNDLTDNNPAAYHRSLLGELVIIRNDSWTDKSLLWVYMRTKWKLLVYNLTHKQESEIPLLNREDMRKGFEANLELFRPEKKKKLDPLLGYLKSIFSQMKTLADSKKTPLYVMRYPSQMMIDMPSTQGLFDYYKMNTTPKDFDFLQLNAPVGKILEELSISTGDITPEIEQAQAKEQLFIESDTHWNQAGNAKAAEFMTPLLKDFLVRNGLGFR